MRGLAFLVSIAYAFGLLLVVGCVVAAGYICWYLWGMLFAVNGIGAFVLVVAGFLVSAGVLALGVAFAIPYGREKRGSDWELKHNELPELWVMVEQLAESLTVDNPGRLFLTNEVNAYASFRNGLPGALSNDRKLTVGLSLLYGLPPSELTAILAHELGHFKDVYAMRVCAYAFEIEGGVSRATRSASVRLRRRLSSRNTLSKGLVGVLLYIRLCELILQAVLEPVFIVLGRLRNRLLVAMEYRADAVAAHAVGSSTVSSAMLNVQNLSAVVGELLSRQAKVGDAEKRDSHFYRKISKRMSKAVLNTNKKDDLNVSEAILKGDDLFAERIRRLDEFRGNGSGVELNLSSVSLNELDSYYRTRAESI